MSARGAPGIKMSMEEFSRRYFPSEDTRAPEVWWGRIFENDKCVWIIDDGFIIHADKPEKKRLSEHTIPALGFGSYTIQHDG